MADTPSSIIEKAHAVMDLRRPAFGRSGPNLTFVNGAFLPCFAN